MSKDKIHDMYTDQMEVEIYMRAEASLQVLSLEILRTHGIEMGGIKHE